MGRKNENAGPRPTDDLAKDFPDRGQQKSSKKKKGFKKGSKKEKRNKH